MKLYSNGDKIVGIESVPGYDLENPLEFWFEGLDKPVSILTQLDEFSELGPYNDAASLIEDQPTFSGDTYYMNAENMKRYIDKHFLVVPFSKGEHSLSRYWVGSSSGWDCGTAGYFLLPREEWEETAAASFREECKNLMECLTAWANGDEYALHEYEIKDGSIGNDSCYGFYGERDALQDACIGGYSYIGEFEPDEYDNIMAALVEKMPQHFTMVEHVEHVPEQIRVIPAHDETWTEFARAC